MPDLARRHGVAENTVYRWKSKLGGIANARATIDSWKNTTTTSGRTDHSAEYRPQCLPKRQPDMLRPPHRGRLTFWGTVKETRRDEPEQRIARHIKVSWVMATAQVWNSADV